MNDNYMNSWHRVFTDVKFRLIEIIVGLLCYRVMMFIPDLHWILHVGITVGATLSFSKVFRGWLMARVMLKMFKDIGIGAVKADENHYEIKSMPCEICGEMLCTNPKDDPAFKQGIICARCGAWVCDKCSESDGKNDHPVCKKCYDELNSEDRS